MIMQDILIKTGHILGAEYLMTLLQFEINFPKDILSHNAKIYLQVENFLPPRIESIITQMNDFLSPFGKSINVQESYKNIMDIYKFLANNPGGITGKLV
ncbi:MAG: hypothetical protein ACTSPW_15385 [Promethearchaeota archaeon]